MFVSNSSNYKFSVAWMKLTSSNSPDLHSFYIPCQLGRICSSSSQSFSPVPKARIRFPSAAETVSQIPSPPLSGYPFHQAVHCYAADRLRVPSCSTSILHPLAFPPAPKLHNCFKQPFPERQSSYTIPLN